MVIMKQGENIRKRKDGRFECRIIDCYTETGKAHYKSIYGKTYTQLQNNMDDYFNNRNKILMNTLCDEWLEAVRIKVKQSTYANYYSNVNNHIKSYFKNYTLKMIDNSSINCMIKEKSINGRLDEKGGLSSKTIRNLVIILKQIIKYAEKKNYIADFDYDFMLPKVQSSNFKVLTPKEQERLVYYLKSTINIEKIGVFLSLYAGLRIGEICALKWRDIDFDLEVLKINKTLQRIKNIDTDEKTKTKIIIDIPKSEKSIKDIPLPSFLLETLKQYKNKYSPNSYILTGTPHKFVEPRLYEKKFKQYLKEIKISGIKFHGLRHTFATRAIENGFDVKSLSEILGHASVEFTLKQYVHSSLELKKSSMERLAICY